MTGCGDGMKRMLFRAGLAALVLAAAPAVALEVGEVVHGFRVKGVADLPDVAGRLWRMEYAKNGADLAWLERDDDNKTFAVAFKTVPDDDTGVAHIMEHSVLCGSEKYPVKEPFVELLKSSMATFLNAMTSADMTWYPVASRNDRDFLNLSEVYLDAVFHPLSVKRDWAMRQEGWHYEYDGTNLTRNGVVYSEMKGVFGNPDREGSSRLFALLFPDNTYGHVSGGDPAHIPELTYEKYGAFYRRHYHPSNARIYLYGKVDLDASLKLIDRCLKDFDRQAPVPDIPPQKPVAKAASVRYESPVETRRTVLFDGWVYGSFADRERELAMDVLTEVLAGDNQAPLKKALLDAGLCEDMSLWNGVNRQQYAVLKVRNTEADKAAACRQLVRATLARLCREGLDRKRLAAVLDHIEFRVRENDTPHGGLGFFDRMSDHWLHGGDPAEALRYTDLFATLRKRIGTGWFEQVLRETLVDNPHHAELTMVPSKTLGDERRTAEKAELARLQAGMTAAELEGIAAATKRLKEHQSTADRSEDLAKLPRLSVRDVPVEGPLPRGTIGSADGNTVIRVPATAQGIGYVNLYFSLAGLSAEELKEMPLLASLYGKLGTIRRSPIELKNELDGRLGRFSVAPAATERGPQLVVRMAALESRREDLLRLAREVLLETDFADTNEIAVLRRQRCRSLERSANADGRNFVGIRATRGLSPRTRVRELFDGMDQLRHLQHGRSADLPALARKIFVRERLTVNLTDNLPADFASRTLALWPATESVASRDSVGPVAEDLQSNGFETGGTVGYAACSARLPDDVPYSGSHLVAAKIVSLEYLWNEIRLKGGAYGGGLYVGASGVVSCMSWRDPSPAKSLGTFAQVGSALAAFADADKPFGNYQVSAVASVEPRDSPSGAASRLAELYFGARTVDDLRRERREILATTATDLKAFAETLKKIEPKAVRCAFGKKELLEECGLAVVEPVVGTETRRAGR